MVGSYDKAKKTNGHYSPHYSYVTKGFFFPGVVCNNVRDYTEPGKDENVNFWVSEESEQVLVKNWVSATGRVKECCV